MPERNIVARTWPNDYNIMQHPKMLHEKQILHEKFDHFKFEPTTLSVLQNVATRHNSVAKHTQHVASNSVPIYCDCLAGALVSVTFTVNFVKSQLLLRRIKEGALRSIGNRET